MNKRRSKALKQLAELLPAAYITRDHTETGRLSELYLMNEKDESLDLDLPVMTEDNCDQIFSIKYPAMEILNHHKRLKAAWKKDKTKGIQDYLIWLDNHNRDFAKRMKDMEIEQMPEGLMRIATAKIGSFWKMLIAFLFSFAMVFQRKMNDASKEISNQLDEEAIKQLTDDNDDNSNAG